MHPACVQDRNGVPPVLQASRPASLSSRRVFADSVYTGERLAKATTIAIEIVRRLPDQVGFQVLPRRWVVERFLAWMATALTKDFEEPSHQRTHSSTPPLPCCWHAGLLVRFETQVGLYH